MRSNTTISNSSHVFEINRKMLFSFLSVDVLRLILGVVRTKFGDMSHVGVVVEKDRVGKVHASGLLHFVVCGYCGYVILMG